MQKTFIHYLFVFCTNGKKRLLLAEIHADFASLAYKFCYELGYELCSLQITEDFIVSMEVKTEVSDESPHTFITNFKAYMGGELRKKYSFLKTRTPGMWTRQHLIQTIGQAQPDLISDFVDAQ